MQQLIEVVDAVRAGNRFAAAAGRTGSDRRRCWPTSARRSKRCLAAPQVGGKFRADLSARQRRELRSAFCQPGGERGALYAEGGESCWRGEGEAGSRFLRQDTGIGIAADHLPRLTGASIGSTVAARARPVAPGWIWPSSSVLERHQAVLQIESEPGAGLDVQRGVPPRTGFQS